MLDLMVLRAIEHFFVGLEDAKIDIYNEFSLQHELGIHLRQEDVLKPYIVQFECPVSSFGIYPDRLVKKEIDIAVFARDPRKR